MSKKTAKRKRLVRGKDFDAWMWERLHTCHAPEIVAPEIFHECFDTRIECLSANWFRRGRAVRVKFTEVK